jgi:hypothetical protein
MEFTQDQATLLYKFVRDLAERWEHMEYLNDYIGNESDAYQMGIDMGENYIYEECHTFLKDNGFKVPPIPHPDI